jgi:hypothetical protein
MRLFVYATRGGTYCFPCIMTLNALYVQMMMRARTLGHISTRPADFITSPQCLCYAQQLREHACASMSARTAEGQTRRNSLLKRSSHVLQEGFCMND